MGVSYKVGSFLPRTGTGTQDITDVGFQPKALIIWGNATAAESFRSSIYQSYGFSDGTNDCSIGYTSSDGVATSATESNIYNDAIIQIFETNGTYYGRATVNSFLSNGFQLDWSVNSGIAGSNFLYMAIGGTDITNVKVGTQSLGSTTTGNKSYTGVGFQGDFLLTANSGFLPTGSAYTYNTTTEAHGGLALGCATSSSARWSTATVSEDARAIMDTSRNQRGDKCFSYLDNSSGTLLAQADFVSWDSDGWTWNYSTNTTANNQNAPFIYLTIKGGIWDVGYFQSPTTNTTVTTNTTSSPACTLRGLFISDIQSDVITSATIADHSYIDIGASDGTNTGSTSLFDWDNVDPSIAVGLSSNTYLVWQMVAAATEASSTTSGRCTVSFASNSFTTTWTNTDGAQRYMPYFAVSESSGPTLFTRPITETSISVSDSLTQITPRTLYSKTVSVLSNSGTGTQNITFTPNGSEPSWTPKAAIVTWSRANTTADAFAEHMSNGFGFTDGTNSRCVVTASEDNATSSDTARIQRNNALISPLNPSGTMETVDAVATFVSWLTNGMQITWSDAPAAQFYINVLFLGGDDITNVNVGTLSTGTGTSPISVTSLAYQPDCGLFLSGGTATENTGVAGGFMSIGAAKSNSAQWVQSIYALDASNNMVTKQYYSDGKVVVSNTTAVDGYATFTSFNSNGFTLTPTDAFPSSFPIYYLVIKGGSFAVGNATEPGSVSTQTITTSQNTSAVMIFGLDTSTADAVQSGCMQTIGMSGNALEQGIEVFEDTDVVGTSVVVSRHDTNQIYLNVTSNATAASSTLDDEAALSAVASDGFTMNWTNVGQTRPYRYITFGKALIFTLFTAPITEPSISVSDSQVRMLTANRSLADTITVSDANARLLTAFRTFSESSITVSDTNTRIKIAPRSISEASLSVSDSLARLLIANRAIADTITVSDSLSRFSLKIRAISEASISVSDVLARVKIALRSISEASISVSDTVARLFTAVKSLADTITVSDSVAGIIIAGLITRTITEASISVSETVARLLTANRTISEGAISVSDTLSRFSLKIRSLSEPSISVSDTLARIAIRVRNISEGAISVSETLSRFSLKLRSISETVTVSETLARIKIGIRSISEATISVSDTLARLLTANRAISDTITVSDTLTRFSLKIRSIVETVTVSDTVARVLVILRSISEPSISVSDALARIKIGVRALAETAITVSDTLARTTVKLKTITEAAISVSDSLVIDRTKIRAITELPITVSEIVTRSITSLQRLITEPSISVSDTVVGIEVVPVLATYITDDGYTNEIRARITFKSKVGDDASDPDTGDEVTFYQYDSFVPEARPFNILSWDLRLVQDEVSIATIDIEDHAGVITDKNKISFKAVVEIDFKKELGREWQRMMTGFVRRIRTVRPGYNALIYRITVLSKQIVYNERVVNFKRAAKRSAIDSSIPLSTDSKMEANQLFRELHTATDIIPLKGPTVQQTGDFDLDTGSISEEVKDFIAEIAPGLGTSTDVARAIAEVTGAIWGTDEYGNPYLRYPTEKHSGIILKDNPSDTDSAWNTSINMSAFEFEDIIDNSEGFANRLYVLNSKDTKSTASSSQGSGNTTLTTRWIAQSFISTDNNITGAAFILSKIGNPTNTSGTIKGVLRANNVGGSGTNYPTGSTLATFEISLGSLANSADVIFVNDIKTANGVINPGSRYWWVLQGTGLNDDTNTVRWHHDNDLSTLDRPSSARLPLVDADPTKPGQQLNWIPSTVGPVYAFSTFSSINHILTQSDSESIASTGTLVEAVVNLPAFNDDATYQKVLVQLLKNSSKIKRIYEYARVTIPTAKFFLPGELVTLIDSKAKLNSEKVIHAEIVEVSYTMSSAIGCRYADLRLIGFIDPVLDNYLSTHEC